MGKLILSIVCCLSFYTISANEVVMNGKTNGIISCDHKIEYFKTQNRKLNIYDVIDISNNNFAILQKNNLNLGFSSFVYWFRIKLVNSSDVDKKLILVYKYPLLNYVHFYTVKNNKIIDCYKSGECYSFESRKFNNRNFLYPVNLKPHDTATLYIRIFNNGETIKGPLIVYTDNAFFIEDQKVVSINFFYYGFLFFALVFGLFLFITNRDKTYLFFFFFTLFLSFFYLTPMDGRISCFGEMLPGGQIIQL
jgi:hypothetical protein